MSAVEIDTLIDGVERYRRTKPADREWCNPATWLNQGRWADEPALPLGAPSPPSTERASPIVEFAFYRKAPIRTWRKSRSEWSIVEIGRWGPRWLHSLVWRMASNLGMIRHARDYEDRISIVRIDRSKTDLFNEMRVACCYSFDLYGFHPGKIKIICGELEIDELVSSPAIGRSLSFDLTCPWFSRDGSARIDGVPLKVVPGLKGWAVVPADI